jgi:hypothetical protein
MNMLYKYLGLGVDFVDGRAVAFNDIERTGDTYARFDLFGIWVDEYNGFAAVLYRRATGGVWVARYLIKSSGSYRFAQIIQRVQFGQYEPVMYTDDTGEYRIEPDNRLHLAFAVIDSLGYGRAIGLTLDDLNIEL